MMPWNSILAIMDFFEASFPDQKPQFSILVAVSAPLFLVQLLAYFFLQLVPIQLKMTVMFAVNAVLMVLFALLPIHIQDQSTGYICVLLLSVVLGCTYAVLQSSLYAVAGSDAGLINKFNLGMGLSGLAINLTRMGFLALITNLDIEAQCFLYGSALYLLVCAYLSFIFVKAYQADPVSEKFRTIVPVRERYDSTIKVYRLIWREAWEQVIIWTVQFSFYPGVILEPQFQFSFTSNFSWFVITVVTFYSVMDVFGRFLANIKDLISKGALFPVNILRAIFFTVLYVLTWEQVCEQFFGNQWFIIILLGLFSSTCGYLVTVGMKYGSDEESGDRSIAGTLLGIHLSFGITLGSTIAILFFS